MFEPNKNSEQLGIDTTRKFMLNKDYYVFKKGDIVTLKMNDGTPSPFFWDEDRRGCCGIPWAILSYAPEKPHYKKYLGTKTAVHVPTQEDWDRVMEVVREEGNKYNSWSRYKEGTCLNCDDGCFARKNYYENEGYKIISVAEFFGEGEDKLIFKTSADACSDIRGLRSTHIVIDEAVPLFNLQKTMNTIAEYRQYNYKPNNKTFMQIITEKVLKANKSLQNTIKRLSAEYRDLYKAGYINGDLQETEKYDEALMDILREKHREEITQRAKTEIEEAEKEEAKK